MLIPHLSIRRHLPLTRPEARFAFLLFALLLSAAAPRAQAQSTSAPAPRTDEDSRFSVGAGPGYTFFGDSNLGGATRFSDAHPRLTNGLKSLIVRVGRVLVQHTGSRA